MKPSGDDFHIEEAIGAVLEKTDSCFDAYLRIAAESPKLDPRAKNTPIDILLNFHASF